MRPRTSIALLPGVGAAIVFGWLVLKAHPGATAHRPLLTLAENSATQASDPGGPLLELSRRAQEKGGIVAVPLMKVTNQTQRLCYGLVVNPSSLLEMRHRYVSADAQAQEARAKLKAAEEEYQRVKLLYDHNHNVSQQVLQAAEEARRQDLALVRATEQTVRASGETARQRWGAVLAAWMTNDTPAFQGLVLQEALLLQITAPRGTAWFPPPATATVQTSDRSLVPARFVCPAAVTDPRIQGQSFYYMTTNPPATLLPGMSISALLPTGEAVKGGVVPSSAVVWWQGLAWAYFQEDSTHFIRRRISTDQPCGEGWFQARPFPAGKPVVVTGAQWLLTTQLGAGAAPGD